MSSHIYNPRILNTEVRALPDGLAERMGLLTNAKAEAE